MAVVTLAVEFTTAWQAEAFYNIYWTWKYGLENHKHNNRFHQQVYKMALTIRSLYPCCVLAQFVFALVILKAYYTCVHLRDHYSGIHTGTGSTQAS